MRRRAGQAPAASPGVSEPPAVADEDRGKAVASAAAATGAAAAARKPPAETPARTKALAAMGLVCVSTTVGVLYKVSQAATGGFRYSTTSAIAIAEMAKFVMSCCFHVADPAHKESGDGKLQVAWASARSQLSYHAVGHIWFLAALYTTNNQLSFYTYTLADPGTIFLFKSGSTLIVATIQVLCVGKRFSFDQWKAMFLQGIGMIVVQYNPCRSAGRYHPLAYLLMAFSTLLTALCAVRNEYLVKNYKIGLNVQNATLYSGGALLNLFAFFCLPNPNSSQATIGFLEGYDSPLAIAVVLSNALIGLAITAVYKYADAVTKCIASDITAVLLCIVSSLFFELSPSLTMWCGVVVVCFAVHEYTAASAPKPAAAKVAVGEASDSAATSPVRKMSDGTVGVQGAGGSPASGAQSGR